MRTCAACSEPIPKPGVVMRGEDGKLVDVSKTLPIWILNPEPEMLALFEMNEAEREPGPVEKYLVCRLCHDDFVQRGVLPAPPDQDQVGFTMRPTEENQAAAEALGLDFKELEEPDPRACINHPDRVACLEIGGLFDPTTIRPVCMDCFKDELRRISTMLAGIRRSLQKFHQAVPVPPTTEEGRDDHGEEDEKEGKQEGGGEEAPPSG